MSTPSDYPDDDDPRLDDPRLEDPRLPPGIVPVVLSPRHPDVRDDEYTVLDMFARSRLPRATVLDILRARWRTVLVTVIAFTAGGIALGVSRPIVYTGEARLSVGKADPSSDAFGSFVTGASDLAGVYSRDIGASAVITPVSQALNLTPAAVEGHLSATPVLSSPIIRVLGTAPVPAQAVAIANAGAAALTADVTATNRTNPDSTRLLGLYQKASLAKAQLDVEVNTLSKRLFDDPTNTTLLAERARDVASQRSAQLQLNAIGAAYTSSEQSQSTTAVLFPLSQAVAATNNRSAELQTFGGAGLLDGLLFGVALAMLQANLSRRRRNA